jgi:hypothetical protein
VKRDTCWKLQDYLIQEATPELEKSFRRFRYDVVLHWPRPANQIDYVELTQGIYFCPDEAGLDMILKFVTSLKLDVELKQEVDAWVLLGLCALCNLIKKKEVEYEVITAQEMMGLKELDDMLERHQLPWIFKSKYDRSIARF